MASFPGQKSAGPSVPVILSPAILPNAEVSAPYSFQFTATGGKPFTSGSPYTWNPPSIGNFTLSPGGLLFNTATLVAGSTFNFSITVTDSVGAAATQGFQLTTLRAPAITTVSPLPGANAGIPYSVTFAARDGTPPYTWAATSGLPSWATVDPVAGTLSGTPVGAETDSITIQATDSYTVPVPSAPTTFSLSVQAGVGPTGPPQAIWPGYKDSSAALVMAWPPLNQVVVNFTTAMAVGATTGVLATPINPGTYAFTWTGTPGSFGPEYHNVTVAADGITVTLTTNGGLVHAQTSGPGGVAQIKYDAVDSYNYERSTDQVTWVRANSAPVFNSPLVSTGTLLQPWYCEPTGTLQPGTQYFYRAKAVLNGVESAPSPVVAITTRSAQVGAIAPTPPTDPATWVQPNTPPAATPVVCTTQAQFAAALLGVNLNGPNIIKLQSNTTFAATSSTAWTLPALTAAGSLWITTDQAPEINPSGTLIAYRSDFPTPFDFPFALTAAPALGATSATLTLAWPGKDGAYWTIFTETATGYEEQRQVLYSKGSNVISWPANLNNPQGLTAACTATIRVGIEAGVTPCPTDLAAMATLQLGGALNSNGISVPPAAKNVRIVGVYITPLPGAPQASTAISFPTNPFGVTPVVNPDHIYLDRCLIGMSTADPNYTYLFHGIALNADHFFCNQTHIRGIVSYNDAGDANGFYCFGGGPHCWQNVHLEAASEGGIYGGGGVFPASNIPHDIVMRGMFYIKPLMWQTMIPAPPSGGAAWTTVTAGKIQNIGDCIKNHQEFKTGIRIELYNAVFWNTWASKQAGQFGALNYGTLEQASSGQFPITMACPWAKTTDANFHDLEAVNLQRVVQLRTGDVCATGINERCWFVNNLCYVNPLYGSQYLDMFNFWGVTTNSVPDLKVDRCTFVFNTANPLDASPAGVTSLYNTAANLGPPNTTFTPNPKPAWNDGATITNNILGGNWGFHVQNAQGSAALPFFVNPATSIMTNNLIVSDTAIYPAGNFASPPVPYASIGFANWNANSVSQQWGAARPAVGDWNVVAPSIYATASTTGGPIGATQIVPGVSINGTWWSANSPWNALIPAGAFANAIQNVSTNGTSNVIAAYQATGSTAFFNQETSFTANLIVAPAGQATTTWTFTYQSVSHTFTQIPATGTIATTIVNAEAWFANPGGDNSDRSINLYSTDQNVMYDIYPDGTSQPRGGNGPITITTASMRPLSGTGWWNQANFLAAALSSGTASGACQVGGSIKPSEWNAGVIPHALMGAWPPAVSGANSNTPDWGESFIFPARAADSGFFNDATGKRLPEGARLQLDPSLTDTQLLALGVTNAMLPVCHALQTYGWYNMDIGGTIAQIKFLSTNPNSTAGFNGPYANTSNMPMALMAHMAWVHGPYIVGPLGVTVGISVIDTSGTCSYTTNYGSADGLVHVGDTVYVYATFKFTGSPGGLQGFSPGASGNVTFWAGVGYKVLAVTAGSPNTFKLGTLAGGAITSTVGTMNAYFTTNGPLQDLVTSIASGLMSS